MLTYAGIPLIASTRDEENWVEQNLPARGIVESAVHYWQGQRVVFRPMVWDVPLRPVRLGQLYWPRGASQWAVGHFLATEDQLDAILAQVNATAYQSAPLVMGDGENEISTNLWLLPSRPLVQAGGRGLYVLTLVDDRFFWWAADTGAMTVTEGATDWPGVYADLAGDLGITIAVDPIPAAYLRPGRGLTSQFDAVPPLLDAVAYSVGQRIVRNLDGSVQALNWSSSNALLRADLADNPPKFTGGLFKQDALAQNELNALVPATVRVLFPQETGGSLRGDFLTVDVGLTSLNLPQFPSVTGYPWRKVIWDNCVANYTGGVVNNQAELDTLADQIATDWYLHALAPVDAKYDGVVEWRIEGLSGSVEWVYRLEEITTRVFRGSWEPGRKVQFHAGTYGSGGGDIVTDYTSYENLTAVNLSVDASATFTAASVTNWQSNATVNFLTGVFLNVECQTDYTATYVGVYLSGSSTTYQSGSSLTLQLGVSFSLYCSTNYEATYIGIYLSGSSTDYQSGSTTSYQSGSVVNNQTTNTYSLSYVGNYQSGSTTNYQSGSAVNFSATVTVSAGTWSWSGGTFNITGGTWNFGVAVNITAGSWTWTSTGTFYFSAGILLFGSTSSPGTKPTGQLVIPTYTVPFGTKPTYVPVQGELLCQGPWLWQGGGGTWNNPFIPTAIPNTPPAKSYFPFYNPSTGQNELWTGMALDTVNNTMTVQPTYEMILAPGTAARPSLNLPQGVAPTTPTKGDMWFNGTNLDFYDGVTTHDLLSAGTTALAHSSTVGGGSASVTSTTFADTGYAISLPSAGTYLVFFDGDAYMDSTSAGDYLQLQLYNATTATAVASTVRQVVTVPSNSGKASGSFAIHTIITVAGATNIKLQALVQLFGTGTATVAKNSRGAFYIQIG